MSIEASLPMLLAIFGVSCSVFGVNILVMGRLCRSKGIELSRQDIRQMRQSYVSVAVALVCLIVLVATSALSLIDARVGLALIAFELVGAGVGAFAAKKSVDDNWEKHPFDDESDWCEVCTYFSGEHAEHTLTPIQWTVVDHLLGLSTDEPYSDDYLADQIVPAILKAFKEIQA